MTQLIGFILILLGAAVLWSPLALVIGGSLLVVVPELLTLRRRS